MKLKSIDKKTVHTADSLRNIAALLPRLEEIMRGLNSTIENLTILILIKLKDRVCCSATLDIFN